MNLHEGKFIKRALITVIETSAIAYRTILRVNPWLGELTADQLNRIVLYIKTWYDALSHAAPGDAVIVQVVSNGLNWAKAFNGVPNVGAGNAYVPEIEFAISYPPGVGPGPGDTIIRFRCSNWAAAESHRYLVEVQAYLLEIATPAVELTF